MLNPFFLNGSKSEQSLVQSLINEQLRMYGVEVYYMPRKYVTKYSVIREVIESEFDNAYPLEAYVDNYEGYGGQGTILSKFGIENKDDLTLVISRERFETYITPLTKNLPNIELSSRPKEGDLIYFPLGDRLFEIKFVEHEQPFYQLKKNYVYELKCELFRYEDEVIDTGVESIDDEIQEIGYIQTLNLVGTAVTATGSVNICPSGAVRKVYIKNMGRGYSTPPRVAFSSAPNGGITAEGIANLSFDYAGCGGSNDGKIISVCLTNAGCGYTVNPVVTFIGGGGSGAIATSGIVTSGAIRSIDIINPGSGYTSDVNISVPFSNSPRFDQTTITYDNNINTYDQGHFVGFITATGVGKVNSAGIVTFVCLTDAGAGYGTTATPIFEQPAGISTQISGSFIFNEVVIGQTSGTEARVKKYDAVSNTLEISIVSGTFIPGEFIIGQESGSYNNIVKVIVDDLVTPYADNDTIEIEADKILDFSEDNPFGMP